MQLRTIQFDLVIIKNKNLRQIIKNLCVLGYLGGFIFNRRERGGRREKQNNVG